MTARVIEHRPICRDRAAAVAVAIVQIFETAPPNQCRQYVEDYLRDEFADVGRSSNSGDTNADPF
jgi:hypothetical protein